MLKTKTTRTRTARSNGGQAAGKEAAAPMDSALLDLFVEQLKDIYWAEKHLAKHMPKLAKACTSTELKQAFEKHLQQTEQQIERLEEVFDLLDEKAVGKKCEAMASLVDEASDVIDDTDRGTMVRDAGLIYAAQKVEHYEIASYGTLRTFASVLGLDQAQRLLEESLEEEKTTDLNLTSIAEGFVNESAKMEKGED